MRDTIIIELGTSAGASGLHFFRLLAAVKKRVRRLLRNAKEDEKPVWRQRLEDLDRCIIIRAADIDTTNTYRIPEPLDSDVAGWPIGTFIPCPAPGPDTVENIKRGRYDDFPFLNPESFRALDAAENASGGARPNGILATHANHERLEREIREAFRGILQRRQELADPRAESVRVVLPAGLFGGFGSGAHDYLRRMVLAIALELGLRIDFLPILFLPGTNPSKDPINTNAVACAVLKEQAAEATQFCWRREKRPGAPAPENVRDGFRPAILLSDTNGAPGTPRSLSIENFHAMVGEFLLALVLSDIGGRFDSLLGDFGVAGNQLTALGEPRYGRSIGISTIYLDRERQFNYSGARLAIGVLDSALTTVDGEDVRGDVRAFLESRRLVEGAGRRDLSELLLERRDGPEPVSIERFRQVFRANCDGLAGLDLLARARDGLTVALEQSGDAQAAFAARREAILEETLAAIEIRKNHHICTAERGPAVAGQWAEILGGIVDTMIAAAGQDSADLQEEVARHQRQVDHFEQQYIPAVTAKNRIYKWYRRRQIEANALLYRQALENLTVAQLHQRAHLTAIEILNGLTEPIKACQSEIQAALQTISDTRTAAVEKQKRIEGHDSSFGCPVGLPLIKGEKDLAQLHRRLLTEEEENKSISDTYARLRVVERPLEVLSDPNRLEEELANAAETILRSKIEALHVVDELLHRYGQDSATLGALLRERDLEAFERLRLKDSSEQENGLTLVRLLGIDAARTVEIAPVLDRFAYPRGVAYEPVDIGDRDRIIFLQVRAVFPLSEWAGFAAAGQDYRNTHQASSFEKHHIYPGDRSLPSPGQELSPPEVSALVFRAWVLDRLKFDSGRNCWTLESADGTEAPLPLGANLELFSTQEGYRRAVDIVSQYNCLYLEHGPSVIEERIALLAEVKGQQAGNNNETEKRVADLFSDEVRALVERELDWWRRNTVPSAMEWGRVREPKSRLHVVGGRQQ
jgi:hypothetical protein